MFFYLQYVANTALGTPLTQETSKCLLIDVLAFATATFEIVLSRDERTGMDDLAQRSLLVPIINGSLPATDPPNSFFKTSQLCHGKCS